MNQPWIYMYSPSWSPLLPYPSPHISGSSQCTSPKHLSHASNLGWWSVSPLIIYTFHVLLDHLDFFEKRWFTSLFLKLASLFFYSWVVEFFIYSWYIYDVSPILFIDSVRSVNSILWNTAIFNFDKVQLMFFPFIIYLFGAIYKKH